MLASVAVAVDVMTRCGVEPVPCLRDAEGVVAPTRLANTSGRSLL